jgi:hypothetical protein
MSEEHNPATNSIHSGRACVHTCRKKSRTEKALLLCEGWDVRINRCRLTQPQNSSTPEGHAFTHTVKPRRKGATALPKAGAKPKGEATDIASGRACVHACRKSRQVGRNRLSPSSPSHESLAKNETHKFNRSLYPVTNSAPPEGHAFTHALKPRRKGATALPKAGAKPEGRSDRILPLFLPLFLLLHFFSAFSAQKTHVKPQNHLTPSNKRE